MVVDNLYFGVREGSDSSLPTVGQASLRTGWLAEARAGPNGRILACRTLGQARMGAGWLAGATG
jgi:hypothetical protein